MWELVHEIGTKLGRPKEEINAIVQLLSENWITHAFHWKALPPEKRRLFNLPILLEHEIETMLGESTVGIKRLHPDQPIPTTATTITTTTQLPQPPQGEEDGGAEEPQTKRAKVSTENPEDDPAVNGRIELVLNPQYITKEFLAQTKLSYRETEGKPFPHCFLPNCLNEEFLGKVRDEIVELEYKRKSNDLYDFWQSDDLKVSIVVGVVGCRVRHSE